MIGYLSRWRTQGVARCSTTCRSSRNAALLNAKDAILFIKGKYFSKCVILSYEMEHMTGTKAFMVQLLSLFSEHVCVLESQAAYYITMHLIGIRFYLLNLSISLSRGKDTNMDSLSSGERRGRSSLWKSMIYHWVVVYVLSASRLFNFKPFGKGLCSGENPEVIRTSLMVNCTRVLLFEIRVTIGGSFHQNLNIYEVFDSREVPWGNIAKYSGKRVK